MRDFLISLPAEAMLFLSIVAPFWIWRWTPLVRRYLNAKRWGFFTLSVFWVLAGVVIMALGCMNTAMIYEFEPLWMFALLPLVIPLVVWWLEEQKAA